jgi:outer membrane protein assembly factor BamB
MKVKPVVFFIILAASLLLGGCATSLPVSSWPGLAATDSTAYLASGQHVYAINLNTQTEVWRYPKDAQTGTVFFNTPIITGDGQLILGSSGTDHNLYSINAATGAENWVFSQASKPWMGDVLATAEAIYAPNSNGTLYAIDPANGAELWKYSAGDALWGQPATDGKQVFIGSLDHFVYALDAQTGRELWKAELDGAVVGGPVAGPDGLVYAVSFSNTVKALDAATGSVRWTAKTEAWVWTSPALHENVLYFGDLNGTLYALNASDGSQVWAPQQPNGPLVGRPLVTDKAVIFAGEDGKIVAVDFDGTILWPNELDGKIYTAPVKAGGYILIAPMSGEFALVALNSNGGQAWPFTLPK